MPYLQPTNEDGISPFHPSAYGGPSHEDTAKSFSSFYDEGTSSYAPFEGDTSKIDQLQKLYGGVGKAYDVTDTLKSLQSARETNMLTGEQAASNASEKFVQSIAPGQGSAAAGAMVRAQALLPYLNEDRKAAGEAGQYADSAKQKALSASAEIATSLAKLQQDYTNSLASYNSGKAQFGLGFANAKTGALASSDKLSEDARQANMSATIAARGQDVTAAGQSKSQRIQALQLLLSNMQAPGGSWSTDNGGNVNSGYEYFNANQDYEKKRSSILGELASIQ